MSLFGDDPFQEPWTGSPGDPTDGGTDEGSNGEFDADPIEGDGGVIIIGGGDAAVDTSYDVVSVKTAIGASYISSQNGSMTVSNSVSCLSRVQGFMASNTSSMKIDACAAAATNYGMVAANGSSQRIAHSTSAVCTTTYYLDSTSTQRVHYSAAIFPLRQGVYARGASSFISVEFEIMTKYYNPSVVNLTPTLFQSGGNAYIYNSSTGLSTKKTSAGFSGEFIGVASISFVWVDKKNIVANTSGVSLSNDTDVSYRYVPLPHSLDYNNVVNSSGNPQGGADFGNLVPLIAHRTNYFSVKPPAGLIGPEDGSGRGGLVSGLLSDYTLFGVIYGPTA